MRHTAASILTLCLLAGCERAAPPQSATPKPAAPPAEAAKMPVSLTITRLDEIHKALDIGQPSLWNLSAYIAPRKPGLVFVDAPAGEPLLVRVRLRKIQPSIPFLIAISGQPLSPLPPWPAADATDNAQLAHPASRILNFTRLRTTDAARCWDENDYNGAADRLTAPLRWARQFLTPNAEYWVTVRGGQCLTDVLLRLEAQTAAGLATHLDAERRTGLLQALAAFDPADPTGKLAAWEATARGSLAFARAAFGEADASEKLATHINMYGVDADTTDRIGATMDNFTGSVLIRRDIDKVRGLSAATISGYLDAAEAMIGPAAVALRSPDALIALKPLQAKAAADPSQVARIVLGAPAATFENSRTMAKLLSDCTERLTKSTK